MRLKTKFQDEVFDLGEVVEADIYYGGSGRIKVIAEPVRGGMITFYFETLKGMNEMFEDAPEEPKEYWYIDWNGEAGRSDIHDERTEQMKLIGNYFESKEEAEKAVEKLKAFKRLKDKGFSFDPVDRYEALCGNGFNIPITATMPPEAYTDTEVSKDLDICFGGEE